MPSPRSRRVRLAPAVVLGALSLCLSVLPASPASAQGGGALVPSSTSVREAPEHGKDALRNTWNFHDRHDAIPATLYKGDIPYGANTWVGRANNRLQVDAGPGRWFMLLKNWGTIANWGRDTGATPVNPYFNRLSFHMHSSAAGSGRIYWWTCDPPTNACKGSRSFDASPGWHTYDIPLVPDGRDGNATWSGSPKMLWLAPNSVTQRVELDWVRLHRGGHSSINLAYTDPQPGAGSPGTVYWDRDTDWSNNTAGNPGWGVLSTFTTTGTTTNIGVNTGALPPGRYHFSVVEGGRRTTVGAPVTITSAPAPRINHPSPTSGQDWAAAHLGDPWDFNGPGDLNSRPPFGNVGNARYTFENGILKAVNMPWPLINDPSVQLNLGGKHIDANRYRYITVKVQHEGAFGLRDIPGEGMMSRVIWENVGAGRSQSEDIIALPGWQTYTLDLHSAPTERDLGWVPPWRGPKWGLRFDPNEDRGNRRWALDYIRLTDDPRAALTFPIRFSDAAWKSGTRADIWVDTDRRGWDGVKVASGIPVNQGVNTFNWSAPASMRNRPLYVHVRFTDSAGNARRVYSDAAMYVTDGTVK